MKLVHTPRLVRWGVVIFALIVLTTLVSAGTEPVGQSHNLTLRAPARVGDVVLPAGIYQVTHLMENGQHIMLFKALRGDKKEYRVSCKMQELPVAAPRDEQHFLELSAKDRVLTSLVFAGDKVEHVF